MHAKSQSRDASVKMKEQDDSIKMDMWRYYKG